MVERPLGKREMPKPNATTTSEPDRIRELRELLGSEQAVLDLIKEELREIAERFADELADYTLAGVSCARDRCSKRPTGTNTVDFAFPPTDKSGSLERNAYSEFSTNSDDVSSPSPDRHTHINQYAKEMHL